MQVPATISQNEHGCEGERCDADSSVLLTIPRLLGMGENPIFSSGEIMKNLYEYLFHGKICGFHRENLV